MRRVQLLSTLAMFGYGCGDSDSSSTSGSASLGSSATITQGDGTADSDASSSASADATADDTSATDATGATDPTDPTEPTEPTEPTDPTEPTEPTDPTDPTDPSGDPTSAGEVELPPPDAGLDYQLGGAYPPPDGVAIVSRDRTEAPAAGLYNLCYVNGFQAQPDAVDFWLNEHPELVLRDGNGDPVIDPDWDEMLLDTSTPEKRAGLAAIVGEWIAGCAQAGYQAVEIDNLDTYSRSDGLLSQDNAVEYMAMLTAAAHDVGLAIAQKNSTEILDRAAEMGTDFAVAEECSVYSECGDYVGVYGDAVLMIEYGQSDFDQGCADYPGHSIVLRDLYLSTPGSGDYVYDAC